MTKILHTMIRVINLEESIRFYTEALGMKLLNSFKNEEYRYTLAFLGFGTTSDPTIELIYPKRLRTADALRIVTIVLFSLCCTPFAKMALLQ